jgi:hypothetical protein
MPLVASSRRISAATATASSAANVSSTSSTARSGPSPELVSIYNYMSRIRDTSTAAQSPTTNAEVRNCLDVMRGMNLTHLGLTQEYVDACKFSQCFAVCSEPSFELAVFIIPQGKKLKLHDHPQMAVVSKLLYGSVQVDSYNQDGDTTSLGIPVGPRITEAVTHDHGPWSLSVSDKNFHEFTALSNCAIFDVIFPPYCDPKRSCTYYEVCETVGGALYIKPVPAPDDAPVSMT